MSKPLILFVGERKHVALTVLDVTTDPATPITDYQVALLLRTSAVSTAVWSANTEYDGKRGVWIDGLGIGSYVVLAKAGSLPEEVDIVECGLVIIRAR